MSDVAAGLIGLAVVLLLFLTGIELGFAMALVGFLGFSYIVSWKAGLNLLAKDFFDVLSSYGFTVIPLFILTIVAKFFIDRSRAAQRVNAAPRDRRG